MSKFTKIKEQIGGMGKFKGGSADIQDLSGPNKPVNKSEREQHHEDVQQEAISVSGTASSLGANRSRKTNVFKGSLDVASRHWGGLQSQRGRYKTSKQSMEEDIVNKVIEKATQIKKEEKLQQIGKTTTGSSSEAITVEPQHKDNLKGQLR